MNGLKNNSYWIIGSIVLVAASLCVWNYIFDTLGAGLCANHVLETVKSPDGTKKATVFVRDCGATTDWSTQASVMEEEDEISDSDTGNALIIDADHGKAWPLAIKGWPIIKAKWESQNSVNFHYSKDSSIYSQDEKIGDTGVKFTPITQDFVETEGLEIRPWP